MFLCTMKTFDYLLALQACYFKKNDEARHLVRRILAFLDKDPEHRQPFQFDEEGRDDSPLQVEPSSGGGEEASSDQGSEGEMPLVSIAQPVQIITMPQPTPAYYSAYTLHAMLCKLQPLLLLEWRWANLSQDWTWQK